MAHPLTDAHIEAERRLRAAVGAAVGRVWADLPAYDRAQLDQWLSGVLPVIAAGKRQSVALTDAYIARMMRRAPLGILPDDITLRNGTPPETVYERPFVAVWTALDQGAAYEDAVHAGLARAQASAEMDTQMAMRGAANAIADADDNVYGFQRVADPGACEFCAAVDGAYLKSADAMALHDRCGCGIEPLTAPHPRAAKLPSGVAVHQHGELGPVLADPAHDFTSESQIN